ncbi:hypothetical protein O1611_g6895 [Lasiodiplodia mahajangana]|uniref:Uncharacterized protein n=1 Tax=Lasiodiplodia mahajangana TaxID=1108764 RepID=A0ACC2JHA6_9PEZI|nr:hypothetical protein O1611_g6895 [Lasiodiplodia mahajangana]
MHISVAKILLDAGADVNKSDFLQVTPLHTAATLGDMGLIRLLLSFMANREAIDGMGEKPEHWAYKSGQTQTRDLLLGREVSMQEDTPASCPESVWTASDITIPYFPDFHNHRSGLNSSVIVQVEVGQKVLTDRESNSQDFSPWILEPEDAETLAEET